MLLEASMLWKAFCSLAIGDSANYLWLTKMMALATQHSCALRSAPHF